MSKEIYDVNTGSLISYPCDYRIVTLREDLSALDITTGHITELTNGDGFAATAKARLTTSMQNKISAKGRAYSFIAPLAADAFIIHAEGNEPEHASTADMLLQLEAAANLGALVIGAEKAEALRNMAYSMLEDKSQYGVPDRENVTNDLTLQLQLPAISTAIESLTPRLADQSPDFYNLQGQKVDRPSKGIFVHQDHLIVK